MVGFSCISQFFVRKWEVFTQGGTRGREPSELVLSKVGSRRETAGAFKIHSCKNKNRMCQVFENTHICVFYLAASYIYFIFFLDHKLRTIN